MDELAIRNLIARLARLADNCALEDLERDYLPNFTPNAVWTMRDEHYRGHVEILEMATVRRQNRVQGPGAEGLHVVTTIEVDFESPAEARAHSYMIRFGDTGSPRPTIRRAAQYSDTLRFEDGCWRIAERVVAYG